ncbi:MAG: flagellar basal body rod protein FlgB [Phycisphaerae bacterium]|jgi:flagellar basal-body rod protein FlgB
MIADLAHAGATPVLEQMMRFTAQRQRLLAHNVANIDTPDFVPLDVSPRSFQAALRDAVEARRASGRLDGGEVATFTTREIERTEAGDLRLRPGTASGNVLYHDRNNRDFEGLMQDLAENGMAFRVASDLLRREMDVLRVAISQRV